MFFDSPEAAMTAAQEVIQSLRIVDFVRTIEQAEDICDVYALARQGRGFYLKLTLRPPVIVISLHPLENPTTTASGREVKP